jgi:F-type H+-transporting ATPase subunit epsilon
MYLEIVSPERTLFNGDVESVLVPGTDGSFQMLDNHAPIVSTLIKGTVKILGEISVSEDLSDVFSNVSSNETHLSISSGVVEM